jgi:hypothetical protein
MMSARRIAWFVVAPAALAVLGCSSKTANEAADASTSPVDVDGAVSCETDPRVDTYVANLSKTSQSGAFKVSLVSGDPAPPAKGSNSWTIKITDASGAPMPNLPISVVPFMPDHGHGTSIVPQITASADGTYTVNPLYLFMPGVWRITITLDADAAVPVAASFFFCIEG